MYELVQKIDSGMSSDRHLEVSQHNFI